MTTRSYSFQSNGVRFFGEEGKKQARCYMIGIKLQALKVITAGIYTSGGDIDPEGTAALLGMVTRDIRQELDELEKLLKSPVVDQ